MELSKTATALMISLQLATERMINETDYRVYLEQESKKDKEIISNLKNEIEALNASVSTLLTELNKIHEDSIQEKKEEPETAPKQSVKTNLYNPESIKEKLETARKILEPIVICHFKARALTTEQAQEVWDLYKQGNKQNDIVRFMRAKGITISQPIVHQIVNNISYKEIKRS